MTQAATSARILYVCNDQPYFDLHWRWRAEAVARTGYQVAVAMPPGSQPTTSAIPVLPIRLSRKGVGPRGELQTLAGIARAIRGWRPDLIHSITAKPNLYAGWAARRHAIPIAASVTGMGNAFTEAGWSNRFLQRLILTGYRWVAGFPKSRFLFENEDDRQLFLTQQVAPAAHLLLLPGAGVDPVKFASTPEPSGPDRVVVLPARLLWTKGLGEFVEAARLLRSRNLSVRMVIVGGEDPGNPAAIERTVLDQWLAEGVIEWWGLRNDMPSVLAGAHVVCLPSYREGLPRSLLEASASGRPCVATDTPGCRRAVLDGETGILVPVQDAKAIAAAIERLVGDTALRLRMGQAGRRWIEGGFTEAHVLDATLKIYQDLLACGVRQG